MRTIIVGAGKIGYHIAKTLIQENHDVVILEHNEERAKGLEENLDVQVIYGSGTSSVILEKAGIKEAKLLIAVTESDEVNIFACMLAKQLGVKQTVARVRNPEYVEESNHNSMLSNIDLIINPELVTAKEIVKLIKIPEALDIVTYADGKIQLLELKVPPQASIINMYIKELNVSHPFLIASILRNGTMLIPRGNDQILQDDIIFVLVRTEDIAKISKFLGFKSKKTERVMILGGNLTGYHLAKILERRKISVKIIEKQYKRCLELAQNLENALVLNGDGTDIDFIKGEGIRDTDVFISLTDDDKLNLLVSLLAKHLGAKRAIAKVRHSDYISLMESVGIDVGISPRLLTANAILRFIKRGTNIVSVTLLSGAKAEVLEILVGPECRYAHKKLRDLNFPSGAIIGSIYRQNEVIIPTGEDFLKPKDTVTVFALPKAVNKVEEFFNISVR
ncbi:MAG: Trk system potassium transporter TrkA [Bacillota bacterium]